MPGGLVGTIYTQYNAGFMETLILKKLANFSHVMWICGGFAPCGPSALLATKKVLFEKKKTCHLAILLIMGQKKCGILKISIFDFFSRIIGPKVVFWVKNGVFECFGLSVR